jgi:hypothetical protein
MRSAPGPIPFPPAFNAATASSFSCWVGFACKNGGWLWGILGIIMAFRILRSTGSNIMRRDGHDRPWIWPFLMWPSTMWVYTWVRVDKLLKVRTHLGVCKCPPFLRSSPRSFSSTPSSISRKRCFHSSSQLQFEHPTKKRFPRLGPCIYTY